MMMIAVRPARRQTPSVMPTPRPTFAPVLSPAEGVEEGRSPLIVVDGIVEVIVDVGDEVVDVVGEDVGALVTVPDGSKLETAWPKLFRKTPCPDSQQLGNLSQHRLPSAQVTTLGKKPVVSSILASA
jgi:hypothetical protein